MARRYQYTRKEAIDDLEEKKEIIKRILKGEDRRSDMAMIQYAIDLLREEVK